MRGMTEKYLPRSFRFTPEEMDRLEAAKERHGSYKAAIMAGLDADAEQGRVSNTALLKMLRERLSRPS